MLNNLGNDLKFTYGTILTNFNLIFKKVLTAQVPLSANVQGTSDGNNTGAIVGSVIALLIAIVVVASFVLMKRKNIGFQEILEMIPRKRSDEACMGENDI